MIRQKNIPAIHITITAVFMALNITMSSFGIPVPGGHLYLCDAVICLAAILLNPFEAFKDRPKLASFIGVAAGAVIMVTGYTLGKIFVYSTLEYAIIKLPYEAAQAVLGAVLGMLLCWKCHAGSLFLKITRQVS